ncbi:MAG: ATP-dependent zinc metalloprotease FtsH [Fimbriimonadaceae bacterium]|nr:ATP-dependent zinc metalloprotease FtsH [Fimbriimonadaceae bacterium]
MGSALVGNATKRLTLTEFQKALKDGEIDAVKWQQETIRGEFVGSKERFEVRTPPATSEAGSRLSEEIQATGASLELVDPPAIQGILPFLGFLIGPLLIVGLIYFLFIRPQQAGGNQAMNFGRSRARRAGENTPKVTFDDVAGIDEAKEELFEIVDFLRNTKKYSQLGAKIPKGILLTGPPGVGKTHLARAIAGEAGVPFFHISGSDFVEMFVGVGAARVRDLFETAKAHRPCLIFIDEIDAVGRQRGAGLGGGHDEREQTLNQLLVEMDGFDANSGVIMIAATNRPDVLDPALLRPGRFDRQVVVDPPDVKGREMILNIHRKGKPIDAAVSMATVAKRTPGFTGADLANGLNEAALLAARRGHNTISQLDIDDALDRVMAGPERKSRVMDGTERRIIAYHEAGHALVGEKLEHADPVHKITILPRGMSLGSTWHLPEKDTYLHSEQSLHDRIATLLGGRVAEEIIFGSVTTGASNDLQRVTRIARAMVTEYGMSSRLGTMAIGRTHRNPFLGRDYDQDRDYSEEVARIIDEEVRKIVEHNRERAEQILQTNRRALDEIAQYLLDRETIDREGFLAILDGRSVSEKPASSDDDPAGGTQTPADDPSDLKPKFPAVPPKLEPGTA